MANPFFFFLSERVFRGEETAIAKALCYVCRNGKEASGAADNRQQVKWGKSRLENQAKGWNAELCP